MTLAAGSRLGAYEIVAPLARAAWARCIAPTTRKLERDVAIKVLPEAFAHDPDDMARFEREARAPRLAQSSQHRRGLRLRGIGRRSTVARHGAGRRRDARRSHRSAVRSRSRSRAAIALQIAEALEAAHEHGSSIAISSPRTSRSRPRSKVKVLDFGLAKALESRPQRGRRISRTHPPSAWSATQAGLILGTAGYMSPEQARAYRPITQRRLCVRRRALEMLTGTPAVQRRDGGARAGGGARARRRSDGCRRPQSAPAGPAAALPHQEYEDALQAIGDVRVSSRSTSRRVVRIEAPKVVAAARRAATDGCSCPSAIAALSPRSPSASESGLCCPRTAPVRPVRVLVSAASEQFFQNAGLEPRDLARRPAAGDVGRTSCRLHSRAQC